MNYRIVGADGKVYGPVGLDQIRQWLAEGRVESRTPIHVEGAAAWTSLGLLPEFGTPHAGAPPAIARHQRLCHGRPDLLAACVDMLLLPIQLARHYFFHHRPGPN